MHPEPSSKDGAPGAPGHLRTRPLKDRSSPLRSHRSTRRRSRINRPRPRLRHNHAPNRSSRRRSRSLNRRLHRSNRCRSRSLSLSHSSEPQPAQPPPQELSARRRSRSHRSRNHRSRSRHDRLRHHRSSSSRHNHRGFSCPSTAAGGRTITGPTGGLLAIAGAAVQPPQYSPADEAAERSAAAPQSQPEPAQASRTLAAHSLKPAQPHPHAACWRRPEPSPRRHHHRLRTHRRSSLRRRLRLLPLQDRLQRIARLGNLRQVELRFGLNCRPCSRAAPAAALEVARGPSPPRSSSIELEWVFFPSRQ